ncbi:hypothetical protein COCSUDRAFT_64052 [Coccomyxa subellipsoidea C-169]|uniref:Methyltransferase domain-containing protein n=1 Tax=Coccomyxa subellipsoidea (strain C-169) TaxID=574566 RepID=I0Z8S1_COCSC|nr:hypothetical protein COCSUDRAFT_64052 [Coccomyxa subellipsoidea C-169]EIE27040.1 hypothetical protein COCSUDRAFT_64052 [Coccomyxa subellipsoidea C-169]|eukprot:XP_005651584.1 hypothetical protein COCSUDRAFT_64052 [Coccomyxa subellipsoidea C-169]
MTRQATRSPSTRLIFGLSALLGVGLVSAVLYYSQSCGPLVWTCQQNRAGDHAVSGLTEQTRLIEAIYQETQAIQNEELAKVKPTDFTQGLAILSADGNNWRLKYIWDYFLPAYNCPLKEKIGIDRQLGDNGKWLCGVRTLLKKDHCVVYSFGSNGETTFEQDLLRNTKCDVHVFDPTLSPEVQKQVSSIKGVTLHNYGLGITDGMIELSDSRQNMNKGYTAFPVKTLGTIMKELKHDWVDVMKVDIEGAEWGFLADLVAKRLPLPFTQLQVEYHYFHKSNITVPRKMLDVLKGLTARDMRVFNVEPNYWWANWAHEFMEFAYVQVNKYGEIVTGPQAAPRKFAGTQSSF